MQLPAQRQLRVEELETRVLLAADLAVFTEFGVPDAEIAGSDAELIRTEESISVAANTTELVAGDAVTGWWVVFNNPELCEGACTDADLVVPEVQAGLYFADGTIVAEDGTAKFAGTLKEGDTSGLDPDHAGYPGAQVGLIDAQKAEVHFVLRTHGAAFPEGVPLRIEQLTTFNGGCNVECEHVQSAAFPATLDRGDFNGDSRVSPDDIDLLFQAIRKDNDNPIFDLTGDGNVDAVDVDELVRLVLGTRRGDANLDGIVNFEDFTALSSSFGDEGGWSDGDFDGNGVIGFADFLALSTNYASTIRLTPSSNFSLAEAIVAAGPRGTVIVEAGTYSETSVTISEPVTIIGEEGATIEFDSQVATTVPRVIDAGFHVKNTQHVKITGLEIQDSDAGSTAILIEGSEHISIEGNRITDFQYGVLVESANHSTVNGNLIGMSSGILSETSFGILVVNGSSNQVRDNTASEATFGIFVSGDNGMLMNNTASNNFVGIILCNFPASIQLPDADMVSGSKVPATDWLAQGNTSTSNVSIGYLVIDGANNNTLTNNQGGDNGTYDIKLAGLGDFFGLPDLPATYDNVVNADGDQDVKIKDCGTNNQVHGGDQVDIDVDTCP